jgi:hypothetical protein
VRAARLICARSPSCADARGNAARTIGWLARRLRDHPVTGAGRDASGRRHRVRVTEATVPELLLNDAAGYVFPSEVGAAAAALRRGDRAPLLRLAAEADERGRDDAGDPTEFSMGASFARFCNDNPMPWDKSASLANREAQLESAKAALPDDIFAPFSIDSWLVPGSALGPDPCIEWPAPSHDVPPPIPPGAQLPGNVPAFVLTGDLDLSVSTELARMVADAWPNSRLVEIANSGHHTAVNARSDCADAMIVNFIAELDPGHTGCASKTLALFPAIGRFPPTAGATTQAKRAHGDRSTATARRTATAATAAVTDALRRSLLQDEFGHGAGLHGGTFDSALNADGDGVVTELDGARFARNVAVSGQATYGFNEELVDARVRVHGPHGGRGRLRIEGLWFAFFHEATSFNVRGRLGGHRIHVRVPAT